MLCDVCNEGVNKLMPIVADGERGERKERYGSDVKRSRKIMTFYEEDTEGTTARQRLKSIREQE